MHDALIILASKSPRRERLLKRIVPSEMVRVAGSSITETRRRRESAETFCQRVAQEKAEDIWGRYAGRWSNVTAVIGADTVIFFRGKVIGQPKNKEDAMRILKRLSGQCHEVIIGVAVLFTGSDRIMKFVVKSKVWLHNLSREVIEDYVATGEPLDKAGAYAIQGRGRKLVARYEGSYSNIVGLPIDELRSALSSLE
jgi:septum formation protein